MVHEILMAEMVLSTRDLQINFSTGWCLDMSHMHPLCGDRPRSPNKEIKLFTLLLIQKKS